MQIFNSENIPEDFYAKIEFENLTSVNEIINEVRTKGDLAVKYYAKKFGDGDIDSFEVTEKEIKEAYKLVSKEDIEAIEYAAKNVREFAQKQLGSIKNLKTNIGNSELGHTIVPIEKVACYIPGGNYPLPSSAIMTIIPAKVAGVKEIFAFSPKIQPLTIVAANIAGASKIYRVGGVQAIAAAAYGTESIEKVNKIVGPGNKFVTSAKKQIYGECGIDFLAGPSEVMIIADETANPQYIAADMLAQAEHDKDARAYLLTTSKELAEKVQDCATKFLSELATKEIAQISFDKSFAIIVKNLNEAAKISNEKAPEHLELNFKDCQKWTAKFTNYGSLFIGENSAEVFGDYCSGTNHTLPTNQVAKYSGGLSVFDFIKIQTYQILNRKNIKEIAEYSSRLAGKEGLMAHKLAADLRKLT